MTIGNTQQKWPVAIHIGVWTVVLLLPYFLSSADQGYRIGGIPGSLFVLAGLIHAGIFYFNALYLYPRLVRNGRWWLYVPAAIALIAASFALKYQIVSRWYPEIMLNGSSRFVFGPSVFALIASLIYCRITDGIRKERARKEYEAQQMAAELKFLRSQVNPHFLFNVLTNMVALARRKSDLLEDALLRLSDLMRYMTYDSQAARVTLQQEADYLKSYIELQKLRFSDSVHIETQAHMDPETAALLIEPLLLVPFVENAFKHGATSPGDPYVIINLQAAGGRLTLVVENAYDANLHMAKDDNSGIGLENVRARLKLIYPGKHRLDIDDRGNVFRVTFNLTLL